MARTWMESKIEKNKEQDVVSSPIEKAIASSCRMRDYDNYDHTDYDHNYAT